MKNILSLIIIIACVFYISSCKEKNANTANSEIAANQDGVPDDRLTTSINTLGKASTAIDSDVQLGMIKNMTKIRPDEIKRMIQDAEVIIKHRYKETDRKSHIILDKDLWEYEYILTGNKVSDVDQFAGCWIDFSEDLTYTYGRYQEELGGGKYAYSWDSGLLLLIDNANNIKPQEYEAKLKDKTLVMDGNDIYKDNNYIAKLLRITERPTK